MPYARFSHLQSRLKQVRVGYMPGGLNRPWCAGGSEGGRGREREREKKKNVAILTQGRECSRPSRTLSDSLRPGGVFLPFSFFPSCFESGRPQTRGPLLSPLRSAQPSAGITTSASSHSKPKSTEMLSTKSASFTSILPVQRMGEATCHTGNTDTSGRSFSVRSKETSGGKQ